MILVDETGGETKLLRDRRLYFCGTKTVFFNKELYVFRVGNPVLAYKITNFISSETLDKTTLPSLPHNDWL